MPLAVHIHSDPCCSVHICCDLCTSILICVLAIDWEAATHADLVHMVPGFGDASTPGVKSCPAAVSQGQTQAVSILTVLMILMTVQPPVAWTQAVKFLNYVTQQTPSALTAAGPSVSEGT